MRADSGVAEAKHDQRLSAAFSAYTSAMVHGQKSQLIAIDAQCKLYSTPKACRALTATPDKATSEASKIAKIINAYAVALNECGGIVGKFAGTKEQATTEAESKAAIFAGILTAMLSPVVIDAKEQAKAKAKATKAKAEKTAKAKAENDAAIKSEAEKLANLSVLTLDDMAKIVANAMTKGMLSAESFDTVIHAAQNVFDAQQMPTKAKAKAKPKNTENALTV